MPIQKSLCDRLARLNRKASVYQRLKRQAAVLLSHEDIGDTYMLFVVDAENPLVERPVMQLAECDAVFHVVGAVKGMPVNMRGIDPRCHAVQQCVKPAKRAAIAEVLQRRRS